MEKVVSGSKWEEWEQWGRERVTGRVWEELEPSPLGTF